MVAWIAFRVATQAEPAPAENLDALIDSLANKNNAPVIVGRARGPGSSPLFDPAYDWNEQQRVIDAVHALAKTRDPLICEQIAAHEKDGRYCLTIDDQMSALAEDARNWTIGDICGEIASFHRTYPVRAATDELRLGDGERVRHLPLYDQYDDLPLPRRTLREQQIALCVEALDDLPRVKGRESMVRIDDAMIAHCARRLEEAIADLTKSKAGIAGDYRFSGERFYTYSATQAAALRGEWKRLPTAKPKEGWKSPPPEPPAKPAPEFAVLANRNAKPALRFTAAGIFPMIGPDRDWKEDERVADAIRNLLDEPTLRLWRALVAHGGSSVYCITLEGSLPGSRFADNLSIGALCREMAMFQISYPARRAMRGLPYAEGVERMPFERGYIYPGWGRKQPDDDLANLQISSCEACLEDLENLRVVSGDKQEAVAIVRECRQRLEDAVAGIRKSKTGILGEFPIPGPELRLITPERAAAARKHAASPPRPVPPEKGDPKRVTFAYDDPFAPS